MEKRPEQASVNVRAARSRIVYWAVALGIAAVLLYFSLRGIQWREVWRVLTRANIGFVILLLCLATVAIFLRALRWRVLLRAQAPADVSTVFWATSAGYFGNNFLPARAGELIRTVMVSARSRLSKTFVLTTALSERLSDAIALVLISSVVLLTLPVRPGWFDHAATPVGIVGLGGAFAIAILPKLERFWSYLLLKLPVPHRIKEKLDGILDQILVGMRSFHSPKRLGAFLALTAVIWFLDAIGVLIGMHALRLSANLGVAFLLITGMGLGSALPATPGYVGIYQFVAVSILVPFGFSKTDAIAYILMAQACQYVVTAFWGLLGFAQARGMKLLQATT